MVGMTENIGVLEFINVPKELDLALGQVARMMGYIYHLLIVSLGRMDGEDWDTLFAERGGDKNKERRQAAKHRFANWATKEFDDTNAVILIRDFDQALDRVGELNQRRNEILHAAWGLNKSGNLTATYKGKLLRNEEGESLSLIDVEYIAYELNWQAYILNASTKPEFVDPPPTRADDGSLIVPSDFAIFASATSDKPGRISIEVETSAVEYFDPRRNS